jgi:uncharacterized protein
MRIAAVSLCAAAGWAADWRALKPQGYVSDFAGVVDAASRKEIDVYCAALEKATGSHLSLVLVNSLQREPVDDVAHALFRAWVPTSTPLDNRALLLISIGERRDALVAGQPLQSTLTPEAVDAILAETRPALARREYGSALMAAAEETGGRIAAARGKTVEVHLTRRARRTIYDAIPWALAAGAIPLLGLLVWLLRRPPRHPPQESV